MQGTSARIGKNLAALVTARFLAMALNVVLTAIAMRALKEDYGPFVFAQSYPALFTVFATFGIQRLLVRDIARDARIAWQYVWTALAVITGLSIAVHGVAVGLAYPFIDRPGTWQAVMVAGTWVIILWALQAPFEALLTAKERMGAVALAYVVTGALKLAAVWVTLTYWPSPAAAHAAIAGAHGAGFALCVCLAVKVTGWERPRVRWALAGAQIRESLPFLAAMICSMLYVKADMSILQFIRGDSATSVYGPVQRILEPIMMVAGIWGTVVFPALCRFSGEAPERATSLRRATLRFALFASLPMAAGLACVAGPVIELLAGGELATFAPAIPLLQCMAVIIPLFYINGIGQEFVSGASQNSIVVRAYATAAVLSLLINPLAIWFWGVWGVAVAALASNIAISGQFVHGMRAEFRVMNMAPFLGKTVMACVGMSSVVLAVQPVSLAAAVIAGAGVYFALQWLFGTLSSEERRLLTTLARKVFVPSV